MVLHLWPWRRTVATGCDFKVNGARRRRTVPLLLLSFRGTFAGARQVQWIKKRGIHRRLSVARGPSPSPSRSKPRHELLVVPVRLGQRRSHTHTHGTHGPWNWCTLNVGKHHETGAEEDQQEELCNNRKVHRNLQGPNTCEWLPLNAPLGAQDLVLFGTGQVKKCLGKNATQQNIPLFDVPQSPKTRVLIASRFQKIPFVSSKGAYCKELSGLQCWMVADMHLSHHFGGGFFYPNVDPMGRKLLGRNSCGEMYFRVHNIRGQSNGG